MLPSAPCGCNDPHERDKPAVPSLGEIDPAGRAQRWRAETLRDVLLLGDPRRQQDPLPEEGGNGDGLVWGCRARGPRWAFVGFWEEMVVQPLGSLPGREEGEEQRLWGT